MNRKIFRVFSALLIALLALAGCGTAQTPPATLDSPPSEVVETPAPATEPESQAPNGPEQQKIHITDIAGREIVLDKPAERVILTFSFEEYFAVTGEAGVDKVVGWARKYWEGRRQSSWDVFIEKYPQLNEVPDIGYVPQNTLNVETIISLEPDLVLMVKNDLQNAQTDLERLEAAGITVLVVDYHEQTLENHYNSTLMIGKAMGMEDRAQELADFYKGQIEKVTEVIASQNNLEKPKVYVEFSDAAGPDVFGATYGKLMWGAIVEECGGDNIARDLVEGANGTILPEQVLASNPDIIIFAGNQYADSDKNIGLGYTSDKALAEKNMAAYAQRPGWKDINAVINGKMFALYHDLSRHIFDFAGIQLYAKAIHPELFADLDPNASLREFHEKFYPVDYTGVWFVGLED